MDSSSHNNMNNENISLTSIASTILKNWYLYAISIFICVVLAFTYSKITPDKYVVESNVMIRTDMSSTNNMAGAFMQQMGLGMMGQGISVDDEINIIASHSLLRQTAEKMQLNKKRICRESFLQRHTEYKGYAVDLIDVNNVCDTLGRTINFKVKIDENGLADITLKKGFFKKLVNIKDATLPVTVNSIYGDFIINTTPDYVPGEKYAYNIKVSGYDLVAEDLGRNVDIFIPSKLSNLIRLVLETPDVEYGKELLNTISSLYNERGIVEKNIEASNTAVFINERLDIIAAELDIAEREVEKYKTDHNLSDIQIEAQAILENSVTFRTRLIEVETEVKVLQYVSDFFDNPTNRFALIPFTPNMSDAAGLAVGTYNELALKRLNMLGAAKPGSPALKMIEDQIDASRENVIITVKTAKASANIALQDLRAQEDKMLSRLGSIPEQEREFIALYRQKSIKEELYIFLLQKQEENAITLAMASPKGQVVDPAFNYSEPSNLSTFMLLFIGFIIGVVIPSVYLYLKAIFRTKFSTREELERITRIPILGEVCTNTSKQSVVVRKGENSSISELFRLLRTNLQFLLTNKNDKVILLTSSVSGEGKSFVSINLAASFALLNKKVVLVGLDIRSPKLAEYIGTKSQLGITNYLASEDVTVDQIIVPCGVNDQLDVILAGPVPPNPAELLLSNRLDTLFEELRNRYDYIMIDSAPVGMVSDTFSLMRVSDTVVYVCRANYTNIELIRYCNSLVAEERLRNVSLVINATTAKQGYGYGYQNNEKK